jgi:excinuclease ABC subunit B
MEGDLKIKNLPEIARKSSLISDEYYSAQNRFKLESKLTPRGDQPLAIETLTKNISRGQKFNLLHGVTGTGKTYTVANIINNLNRPSLVIAPNKTLAAQLFQEFKEFFPNNRVRYFVSYYDYYQPEAYIPSTDTYIEKDALINEEIDKMRHSATKAILEANDTIIVSSVSCIYGLGSPDDYFNLMIFIELNDRMAPNDLLLNLVKLQYSRADVEFKRGNFRVRGDTIDIFPSDQDSSAIRVIFFGSIIEELMEIDPLTGKVKGRLKSATIYPLSHFLTHQEAIRNAISRIEEELRDQLKILNREGKIVEATRLEQRTLYDLELLSETGFCPGIENYSRHLAGRNEGEAPYTLIDYFPKDFLLVIDESHITVSQLGGMYRGDRARKTNLVNYGFRLPSAIDNRPLKPTEFWSKINQTIFVSATPGNFEIEITPKNCIARQINRPTGLLDPTVEVRSAQSQVDDLVNEIRKTVDAGNRVLVTTLTKKMSEHLTNYLSELGIKCRYLHSDIDTVERVEILRGLRKGEFDVIIGINLLREGLDLVEVALVAILDADKEGFLRSARSLIQTMGRAARNLSGRVIMYGDKLTDSMKQAINETNERRKIQTQFNLENNITPISAQRKIQSSLLAEDSVNISEADEAHLFNDLFIELKEYKERLKTPNDTAKLIAKFQSEMRSCAAVQNFEEAAKYRDLVKRLQLYLTAADFSN